MESVPTTKIIVNGTCTHEPIRAAARVEHDAFARIKSLLFVDAFKWDSQLRDLCTLADFPLLISASTWKDLVEIASSLSVEILAAEREVLGKRELFDVVGI